jgi:hypothetical protein
MLKLSQKRPRDWSSDMSIDPCSVGRVTSPLPTLTTTTTTSPSSVLKKVRNTDYNSNEVEQQYTRSHVESPFPQQTQAEGGLDLPLPRRKPKTKETKETNEITEKLFTYEQVKEIVNRVVAERETALRAEYDRILQERLQEQYRNFAKFNEDYISRQYKESDFSYLS